LALYDTTSFVWTWVAIGLLAAAPRALLRAQAEPALAPGVQLRLPGIDAPPVDSPASRDGVWFRILMAAGAILAAGLLALTASILL
jgi:hypothetical protein